MDAAQVRALHDEIEDRVVYHVLIPLEDAAARIEASMGSLSAGEMLASPAMTMRDVDLDAVRKDCKDRSDRELKATIAALEATGATVGSGTSSPSRRSTRWPPRSPRSTAARRSS